jgi:hypothetical protein
MRNVVGEMKQRMHPKIERFTTGCKALGESKKRQLVGMLAGVCIRNYGNRTGIDPGDHYCSACYF